MHTGSRGPRTLLTYRDEIHACRITLQFMYLFYLSYFTCVDLTLALNGLMIWITLAVFTSFYSQQITHCSEDFQLENDVHESKYVI